MVTLMKQRIQNSKLSKDIKIPKVLQAYLLQTLSELLLEGFSIHQSLVFMRVLMRKQTTAIDYIIRQLESGISFEMSLRALGYSNSLIAQLFYAQRQGRFTESLADASKQLKEAHHYKQKLVKTLVYPVFLAVGLVGMLFAMRQFLLPQVASFISQEAYDEQYLVRVLVYFFTYLPQIFGILLAFVLIIYGGVDMYLLKQSEMRRYQILTRIPLVEKWVRSYSSYKVSKEIGHFFSGGYSIQQTLTVIVDYPIDPFLSELAIEIQERMLKGEDLAAILDELNIFTKELPLVIYQGELTSQTAQKCYLYSRKVYLDLMDDIQAKLTLVQPILFILIGILVMSMYLLMMLPMLTMQGI